VLASALLVAGCAGAPDDRLTARTARIGITDGVARLDPYSDAYDDWLAAGLVYDGLLRVTADGEYLPALAIAWEQVNATRYRFRLRPGVHYSDGTALTAASVIASWTAGLRSSNGRELLGKGFAAVRGATALVEGRADVLAGVRATDSLTIEVALEAPTRAFLASFGTRAFDVWLPGARPVGTGPWRYLHGQGNGAASGDSLRFVRNARYWGSPPLFDTLVLHIVPPAAVSTALITEAIDCTVVLTHRQLQELTLSPAVVLPPDVARNLARIVFNTRSPRLLDPAVRRAIALAVDRQALAQLFLPDRAFPWRSALPSTPTTAAIQPFPATDVVAARAQYAARAGRDSSPLRIAMWGEASRDTGRTIASSIQAQLRDAGIAATVVPPPAQFAQGGLGDIDLSIEVWIPPNTDLESFLVENFHSTLSSPFANSGNVRDSTIDRVIDQLRTTTDPSSRNRLITQTDSLLADRAWLVPLWLEPTIVAHGRRVTGCRFDASRSQFLEMRPAQ
jgi:peptide/nickel transport system substrate-binding protein